MTQFTNDTIDLGKILIGSKHSVAFGRASEEPAIDYVNPDCGCTNTHWNQTTVHVEYQAPNLLPEYHRENGIQEFWSHKTINVHFRNGQVEVLHIKATVTNG